MALIESCTGLSKSFGSRLLFENIALGISEGERLGLIGPNGAGKSTLLKILAGKLDTDSGSISMRRNTRVGYVAQDAVFPKDQTAAEVIAEAIAGEHLDEMERAARINQTLGRAGFTDGSVRTTALSGGWKRRLAIARELALAPDLLFLDEPTNHLDIDSRESLIHALNEFPGAVILISHDRHLLEATADRLWLVKDGAVNPYDGDLEDYKTLVTGVSGDRRGKREADKASKADRRRDAAARRAAFEPLAKEIRATEALMDRIRKRIDGIEDELSNPAVYEKDPSTATRLAKERSQLAQTLAGHEEKWLTMSAEYEEGTAE
jgi:ATP-binding cassette, subfamily F, member 3